MLPGEEAVVSDLILPLFNEYVSRDCDEQGRAVFHDFIEPERIWRRHNAGNLLLVALDDELVVGTIEIRDGNHVALFFVKKEYQNRGVGYSLLADAIRTCRTLDPTLAAINVNSSLYARPTYEHLGFRATGEPRKENGISYVPMSKDISRPESGQSR
jgi:GNAT superfamily N-acetyltransferase